MRKLLERLFPIIVIAGIVAGSTAQVPSDSQRANENVAAFARLFGVVRYFYPSDAADSLDWNRFAVYGVRRVRTVRDSAVLETTLQELFTPLGPNIKIATSLPPAAAPGSIDPLLVAWRYEGPGFHRQLTARISHNGRIEARSVRRSTTHGRATMSTSTSIQG